MTAIYLVGIGEGHLPRYDYECNNCRHLFELRQSFDDEPVAKCPECDGDAHRKISVVPIVFKGSGWYVNDYGKRDSSTGSSTDVKDSSAKELPTKESQSLETNTKNENKSDSTKTQSVTKKKSESKSNSPDAGDG